MAALLATSTAISDRVLRGGARVAGVVEMTNAQLTFRKRQIVTDDRGNMFRVVRHTEDSLLVESVVTKERFIIPSADLTLVPGLVMA